MSHFDPTDDEAARERKLPGWARETLRKLRNSVRATAADLRRTEEKNAELQAQIAQAAASDTGPDDSTAWLFRCTDDDVLPRLGLGKDASVDFTPTGEHGPEYTVECDPDGYLKITSPASLQILPIDRGDVRIKAI